MTVQSTIALAQAHVDGGRPGDALRILAPHLASAPNDVDALVLSSNAYLDSGDSESAIATARQAAALSPHDEVPLLRLSSALGASGRWQDALATGRAAVELAPTDWVSVANLAQLMLGAGQAGTKATELAMEAVRLAPEQPGAHNLAGMVALERRKWSDAARSFQEALRLSPGSVEAQHNLSLVALHRGNAGGAAATMIDQLAQNPNDRQAMLALRASAVKGLQIVHFFIWGAAIIGWAPFNTSAGRRLDLDPAVFEVLRIALPIVLTMAVLMYVAWVRGQAGGQFVRFLTSVPSMDRWLVAWAAILVVAYLMIVACAFVSSAVASTLFGASIFVGAAGALISYRRT